MDDEVYAVPNKLTTSKKTSTASNGLHSSQMLNYHSKPSEQWNCADVKQWLIDNQLYVQMTF